MRTRWQKILELKIKWMQGILCKVLKLKNLQYTQIMKNKTCYILVTDLWPELLPELTLTIVRGRGLLIQSAWESRDLLCHSKSQYSDVVPSHSNFSVLFLKTNKWKVLSNKCGCFMQVQCVYYHYHYHFDLFWNVMGEWHLPTAVCMSFLFTE